jgi:hypothetical protein
MKEFDLNPKYMKNLFSIFTLLISVGLYAQGEQPTGRGNVLIGGSASGGYSTSRLENPSINSGVAYFSFSPTAGYFVSQGLALGIYPSFSYSRNFGDFKTSSVSLGFGGYIKYYFKNGLFISGSTGYELDRNRNITFDTHTSWNTLYIGPEFGYAIFLNSKISLEISINNRLDIDFYSVDTGNSPYISNRTYFSVDFQKFL